MSAYVVFNGVSDADIGVFMEELPSFARGKRITKGDTLPGRHGRTVYDQGGYDTYTTTMKVNCNGRSRNDVFGWLSGEGWLTTSDEPELMAWVDFYPQQKNKRFNCQGCYDTLTISMTVYPMRRLVDEEPMTFSEAALFDGKGVEKTDPVICINGAGDVDLMINDCAVVLTGLTQPLYLDCDAGIAYVETNGVKEFAGEKVTLVNGWPTLLIGENMINWSGTVASVIIQPNWRFY